MAESEKVKERIDELRAEINHHNYRYYVLDSPGPPETSSIVSRFFLLVLFPLVPPCSTLG